MRIRTKKIILLSLATITIGLILASTYVYLYRYFRKQLIQIAIVAPLSGPNGGNGRDMLKGVQLSLDTLRREKRLTDKRIKLLIFDDADDPETSANMAEHEQVQVYSLTKGHRFETYIIKGKKGSGTICLNGASALLADPGDLIIIASYALVEEEKIIGMTPVIVKVDENNKKRD